MMISHSHKFIFVHVYKCAGSAMGLAMSEYGVKEGLPYHCTANEIKNYIIDKEYPVLSENLHAWNQYFKFAFVRNPFDLIVSLYHWIHANKIHDMGDLVRELGFEGFVKFLYFEDPLKRAFSDGSRFTFRSPLKRFVVDKNGQNMLDFVGRFENVNQDYEFVCKKLGIENHLKKTNSSEHPHYRECYNKYTKNLVAEMFKDDLEFFDYKF